MQTVRPAGVFVGHVDPQGMVMTASADVDRDTAEQDDSDLPLGTEDVRHFLKVAAVRAGRRFREGMSPAECAAIHAEELRRVGIRHPRFSESALTRHYERALAEVSAARGDESPRRGVSRGRWRGIGAIAGRI